MPLQLNEVDIENEENPFISAFQNFFETEYLKNIESLVDKYPAKKSLEVDFKELEKFDFELADQLLESPDNLINAAEKAIQKIEIPSLAIEEFKPHIRFYNLPLDRVTLLRDLSSDHINKLITVEGVIKQITDVLPRLKIARWKCNRCGNTYNIIQEKETLKQPVICECKHRDFSLVSSESVFIDSQKIQIQEPIEKLKGNEQPTNLDIIVLDDLVNKVSAGDKIKITGVLRLRKTKKDTLVFSRMLEAVHLEQTSKEFEEIEITEAEIEEIKKLTKDPAIFDKIINSVAPSIYGHETVKEAIALQLFGGVKKTLPDKQTIRGNIHVLLVGDPGVAKSQMMQAAHNIAPKSIYVAGKTVSSVGLTAAAVKDEFGEGGWTLKAGALVLASNGIVMADELDKMDSDDRTALHEAMEQGMISVAKAGIVTRFKTDTSILAASNPKYSRFDPSMNVMQQIDLPATLISRFDLFFVIRDILDVEKDEKITEHILKTHQAGEKLFQHLKGEKKLNEKELKEIEDRVKPSIDPDLFKKYISYARQNIFPVLTDEALEEISSFYVGLRAKGREQSIYSATHRQLEGIVRLSEASARVRLSNKIERKDALRAIKLVKISLEEVIRDPATGKLDIDYITTGQPQSTRDKIKLILRIIREKAKELDVVPLDEVITEAKEDGITKDEAKDIIRQLLKKGELYSPHHGTIKPTEKI